MLVDAAEALFDEGYSRFEIARVVHQALKERERQQ